MKRIVETQLRRMLSLFLVLSMCVGQSYAAEATATTVQLMKTEGTVDVTNSGGRALTVREDMRLYNGYHVNTGAKSYAWVNLDSDKLTKLDESSEMELRKENQKLEILLNEGSIYFNVEKPLEDSESMNIRTSTMVVGIRGTCGWVRVIDRWTTEVSVLEGSVQCTVTDPVSGQIKTTIVKGGEKAVFVVYDPARAGDKCDILLDNFTEEDIPGFVLVELVRDTPLCEKIYADSGLDLLPITREEAENRLKADQAEQEKRLEEREHLVAEQERHVSVDPVWKGDTPVSPDDSSGGGGGGTSSGPSGVIRLTMPVTAREVQNYLDTPAVTGVTLLPGSGNNTFSVDIAMTVPGGKTLTLNAGVPARVEAGNSMTVNGTAGLNDALTNLGTVTVNSADTLRVGGNLTNNSTMIVPATGRSITEGTFTNNQTLTLTAGAQVLARTFDLAAPVAGWTVTGPQSDGYYRLVQTQPPHTITFDGEGSTGTTGEDGTLSNLPVLPPNENGDEFDGWYTQPDGGGEKVTEDTIFTEDTTLYPHWKNPAAVTYTVTFNANGGTVTPASAETGADGKLASLPTPTRAGYVFGGWFTTDGTQVTTSTVFTRNTTVYARWGGTPAPTTYHISLNYNYEGGNGPVVSTQTDGTLSAANLAAPTRTGYTFDGWFTEQTGGNQVTTSTVFTSDDIIYAHWTRNVTATISGTVNMPATEDSAASTVSGATVQLFKDGGDTARVARATSRTAVCDPVRTATDGTYTLPISVAPGEYTLAADIPGYTVEQSITISEDATNYTHDLTLGDAWDYDERTKTLTIKGNGPMADYTSSPDAPWSANRGDITTAEISDGVTTIGQNAFYQHTNLESVSIPSTVTSIGEFAFSLSGLTSVDIPSTVTSIGDCAFKESGLQSITIPSSVTTMGGNVFEECHSLTSAVIGAPNTGDRTFHGCNNLTTVTIQNSVTTIGTSAFADCNSLTSITIPNNVTAINADAFARTGLISVTIPSGVTSISNQTFKDCKALKSVTIPDGVTSIGNSAFYGCSSLTSVTIPDSVTSIGVSAFAVSGVKNITISNSVTSIGNYAFESCKSLVSVEIPDSVTSIGQRAFGNCSILENVSIPSKVTYIGDGAFVECKMSSVTIPGTVTSIGEMTFFDCGNLSKVVIEEGVVSIGRSAFSTCEKLTDITLPNSVITLGDSAFSYCAMTSIRLPDNLASIGYNTFGNCSNLTSVTIPASVTSIGNRAFQDCNSLTTITFTGTQADWQTLMTSSPDANIPTGGKVTVECTDGDVVIA